jgi:DNA polymerase-1
MKILIIDAYNMIHRSRFGYSRGDHAVTFNFFRSLNSEIVRHNADKVFIVSEGRPIHRYEINPNYKGQRVAVKDDSFHRQKKDILDICKYFPITFTRHDDYECDDVIGYLCKNSNSNDEITIISSDSDFIQLLALDNVSLWNPVKKEFIKSWPVDYVTWKALKGDSTDNVPGIQGVGKKRAFSLLESIEVLEDFLNKKPERRKIFEDAYRQIILANINPNSVGWETTTCSFNEKYVFEAFTDRAFKAIIGNTWEKWKQTMTRLDNITNECST